jgi:hypothetical protein
MLLTFKCVNTVKIYFGKNFLEKKFGGKKKAFKIFSNLPGDCEFELRSWRGVLDTTLCD